jgi:hypothetical protein
VSITCPKCGTEIDQDFGLVNCPGCATVLAVDVDGNVQIPAEPESTGAEQPEGFFQDKIVDAEELILPELQEPAPFEAASFNEPSAQEAQPTGESEFVQNSDFHSESFEDEPAPIASQSQEAEEATQPRGALADIEEFGNKDSSSGPLSYTLIVDGIDAGSIRKEVISALDEPQFGWSSADIAKNIKNGQLILKGLAVAQAVMAVRLLRGIKVRISWTQHLYS